jgi:cystathionine gamma-synthase
MSSLVSSRSSVAGTRVARSGRVQVRRSAATCPAVRASATKEPSEAQPLHPPASANNGAAKYRPGTQAVHGGEREGRPRVSDSLTTPIVQTSTYTFKDTAELIAYQEGTYGSYEYGR